MPDTALPSTLRMPSEPPRPRRDEDWRADIDIRPLLAFARRNLPLVAGALVGSLLLGGAYLSVAPQTYSSTARLIIDPNRGVAPAARRTDTLQEKAFIDTQIEILTSRKLAEAVIRRHGLENDRDLTSNGLVLRLGSLLRSSLEPEDKADIAAIRLADRLKVTRSGATYFVEVAYTSGDRVKSAVIANAVARNYLEQQQDNLRADSTRSAVALEQDVARLTVEAMAAERALIEYGLRHNVQPGSVDEAAAGGMADLEARLSAARETARGVRERLDALSSARDGDDLSRVLAAAGPGSATIARLAGAVAEARADEGRLAERPSASEADLTAARQRSAAAQTALRGEISRTVILLRDAAGVAEDYEAALRRDLSEAASRLAAQGAHQVEYRALENRARTLRALADERLRVQTEFRSQGEAQITPALLASEATPALYRASPRVPLVLAIALILGLGLGGGIVVLRLVLDRSLRTRTEVRDTFGLSVLASLPSLAGRCRRRGEAALAPDEALSSGPLADALREIRIGLDLPPDGAPPARTIGILSAERGEGRTTLAINLARSLVLAGEKVLLVDLDGRHPEIHERTTAGSLKIGCSTLAIPRRDRFSHDMGPLRSKIAEASQGYDRVILDLPPLSAAMEVRSLSQAIGHFILVLAAGRTSRDAVTEALEANTSLAPRILGVVLN